MNIKIFRGTVEQVEKDVKSYLEFSKYITIISTNQSVIGQLIILTIIYKNN